MKDLYERLEKFYLEEFYKKGEPYFKYLCIAKVAKRVFLFRYRNIEPMSCKERRQLYRYVVELMPELTNPEKRQAAEIIYAIGNTIS